jgi:hypothetical protein
MGEILPTSSNITAVACALLAACALSACTPEKKNEPTRFLGISSGGGASFTRTPDGCALSFIFDEALAWGPNENTATAPETKSWEMYFELLPTSPKADSKIVIDLRGHFSGAKVPAKIQVNVGGSDIPLTQPLEVSEESYMRRVEAKLTPAAPGKDFTPTPLRLTVTLPRPPADAPLFEGMLTLATVDIALDEPAAPNSCTPGKT